MGEGRGVVKGQCKRAYRRHTNLRRLINNNEIKCMLAIERAKRTVGGARVRAKHHVCAHQHLAHCARLSVGDFLAQLLRLRVRM